MKRRSISWLIVTVMIISNLQLTFAEEFNSYDLLTQVDPYSENTTSNFDEMDNGDEESQEDNYYAYDSEEDYSDSELWNECDSDWEEEECWDDGFSDDCYSYYQKGDCWNDECVNTEPL